MKVRLRVAALSVALAAIVVAPGAGSTSIEVSVQTTQVVAERTPAGTLLVWAPVPNAKEYAVFKGPDAEHLTQVATTPATAYFDPTPAPTTTAFAVAPVWWDGSVGPKMYPSHSDCVAVSSHGKVTLSVWSCLHPV